jgi:hypothetical protein
LLVSLVIAGCGATASTTTTTAHLEQTAAGPTATGTKSPTTTRASTKTRSPTRTPPAATTAHHELLAQTGTALSALDALPVKGRAPKTGYSRDQFGDGWASVAGCDTRDRILARDPPPGPKAKIR